MKTEHNIFFGKSQSMTRVETESVDLVITSPPYPMIQMWDEVFNSQNPAIRTNLCEGNARAAFELMHAELDAVWKECYRALKSGGFLCVNIGDATRTINGSFELFNNHSRIVDTCTKLGFTNLTNVIWRKQTNAPNKFMGSGMLPCGAYITLEHEYILVFRKGGKRLYASQAEKSERMKSSFFWEERNVWFSDIWDFKGVKQKIENPESRDRSAAFPLEVPYRLINMYSQKGDIVLDPFMGLGTTAQAAILLGRNSVGYDIDKTLQPLIRDTIMSFSVGDMNKVLRSRYDKHLVFVGERVSAKGALKHMNSKIKCPVMTGQETGIEFNYLLGIKQISTEPLSFVAEYEDISDIDKIPAKDTLF